MNGQHSKTEYGATDYNYDSSNQMENGLQVRFIHKLQSHYII